MGIGSVNIRPERPSDHAGIRSVNLRAFDGPFESRLVDALRRDANPFISLVADDAGFIVGNICFSPVEIVRDCSPDAGTAGSASGTPSVVGLAPMSVLPEHQGQGIGSMLVEAGLKACRAEHIDAVVVLGHPTYYPRFGFRAATTFGLRSEYDAPPGAFMAQELRPAALAHSAGLVRFHPAFSEAG